MKGIGIRLSVPLEGGGVVGAYAAVERVGCVTPYIQVVVHHTVATVVVDYRDYHVGGIAGNGLSMVLPRRGLVLDDGVVNRRGAVVKDGEVQMQCAVTAVDGGALQCV